MTSTRGHPQDGGLHHPPAAAPPSALPRGLRLLGWCGLLPFAGALALALLIPGWRGPALGAFVAYSAIILSFLGGTRWGRGLAGAASPWRYLESTLPSLLGFAALMLPFKQPWSLLLLAVGYALWLLLDLRDARWSPAYKRMRAGISAVVLLMHAAWWVL